MKANQKDLLQSVSTYYSQKIDAEGPTAKGVDWNGTESQELRFKQLLTLCQMDKAFSINDLGCGYGGLASYLSRLNAKFDYHGSEVSPKMLEAAKKWLGNSKNIHLYPRTEDLPVSDYTIASGIMNVRLETPVDEWKEYTFDLMDQMDKKSKLGFSFNVLTSFSDPEKRASHLYYADPTEYFTLAKKKYSKNVALLHDYGLYEFTLIVRKEL